MIRRPPRSTRTDTLFPYTTLFRSDRGVALLSLEEKIDTSSAAGELIFHVFGSIAHFERRLIAERTKDGIAAARAKGKLPGRRPLDPQKASAALKLVEAGMSPTEAARQLGLGRRSEERSVGKECVRTWRSRWSPYHYKKK